MTDNTFQDSAVAPLAQAVKAGDKPLVRELVAGGANPNATGNDGTPLLQWAMLQRNRAGFEALLAAGADPAAPDASGNTAVTLAAQGDTPYWLETLLAHRASPDTANTKTGETPLMAALMAERAGNADLLLKAGATLDATDEDGNTVLHIAAKINQMDRVLSLLEAGADPSPKNGLGVTFQRYLFMTKDAVLAGDVRRKREDVRAWLQQHGIPVEDPR